MCGRFSLSVTPQGFQMVLGIPPPDGYRPRWNITPDSDIVAVRAGADGPRAVWMRWGLLGPWMKAANDPGRQINARSESAFDKPMFRDAIRRWRCLIPADGFYEWRKEGQGPSTPFRIHLAGDALFAFAGIFRPMRLADGSHVVTCAILTTDAWPSIRGIHHRMPVILAAGAQAAWIDPSRTDPASIQPLLAPRPEAELRAYAIDRRVNNPRFDDRAIWQPASAARPPPVQGELL
jgi:putative SOS response-associated peptidase YedK